MQRRYECVGVRRLLYPDIMALSHTQTSFGSTEEKELRQAITRMNREMDSEVLAAMTPKAAVAQSGLGQFLAVGGAVAGGWGASKGMRQGVV